MRALPCYRYRIRLFSTRIFQQIRRFLYKARANFMQTPRQDYFYFNRKEMWAQDLVIFLFAIILSALDNFYSWGKLIHLFINQWWLFYSLRQLAYSVNYSFIFSRDQFILLFLVNTEGSDLHIFLCAFASLNKSIQIVGYT